jgi:hypothetical protein
MKAATLLLLCAAALTFTPLAASAAGKRFNQIDANHDGRVTFAEFEQAVARKMMSGEGRRADKFRQLSPTQRSAQLQRRFDRLDEGHKGYLTPGDFAAARDAKRHRRIGL